jgi:transcriptional regulator with XRE-family HTH domain
MSTAPKIGARLKQARDEQELTLQGLADLTRGRFTASRLGNYEQGTRLLKPHAAILLAPLLRKSAAWLLCVDEESTLGPDESALLAIYRATDERGKANIRSIAELQPDLKSRPERAA